MATDEHARAVELLERLGMKRYEAECFAALHRVPSGTARELSDVADVPRTRVYDATSSLAEQGFIEVQHTNPQQFRAIPLEEGVAMLREQYERWIEELHTTLSSLRSESDAYEETSQEVWTLSSDEALDARVLEYVEKAETSIVLVLGDPACWSDRLGETLARAVDRGVAVTVCGPDAVTDAVAEPVAAADLVAVRAEDLALEASGAGDLGRLVLVDGERLLVSSLEPDRAGGGEHAVVADGPTNGAVMLSRCLLAAAIGEHVVSE